MHVLILGATGACGTLLVKEALAASHTVVIFARAPEKLSEEIRNDARVTVLKGELDNETALSAAMENVDTVLSALGPKLSHGTYPSGEPLARAYSLIIKVAVAHSVKRLIALGTPSITDPHDKSSLKWSLIVGGIKTLTPTVYSDIVGIGNTIRTEGDALDWTIVRVPFLTNSSSRNVVAGYVGDGKTGTTLSRAGFAIFVLQELAKNEWVKEAPLVTVA
ncbi:NAD(P)-binding protein [Lanmaoa asiatica]|nr:NAD(P)-binding protein [Lanmaoa asiatica]